MKRELQLKYTEGSENRPTLYDVIFFSSFFMEIDVLLLWLEIVNLLAHSTDEASKNMQKNLDL